MKRILIIDNDLELISVLQELLETEGYTVTTSHTGSVLDTLTLPYPDVILLDVMLEGQDGRELCEKLKANPDTSRIPVLMISGVHMTAGAISTCGADGFLAKPFDIERLLRSIKRVTDG
jgi:CheY-like chemotaxis protein